MADWAQDGCTPARTSFQAGVSLGTTWAVAWQEYLHFLSPPQLLHPTVSAIVSGGHVLIATLMGKVRSYAEGTTMTFQWQAAVAGNAPIVCTPAADGTNVYVADGHGRLSAFKLSDGTQASGWTNPVQVTDGRPFRGSVLLADGKLLLGGADGRFYARNAADGSQAWAPVAVGAPILGWAAYGVRSTVKLAWFGAEDLKVRKVNVATGALLATSARLKGASMQLHGPVYTGSVLAVRVQPNYPNDVVAGGSGGPTRRALEVDATSTAAQDTALAAYDADPADYATNLHLLDPDTLALLPAPIHFGWVWGHGSVPAPCVERDGKLVIPALLPTTVFAGGYHAQWARLDTSTRRLADFLGGDQTNARDEHLYASACANGVVGMHGQEENAARSGFYNQDTSTWSLLLNIQSPRDLKFIHQGPTCTPAAIVGGSAGMVYHAAQTHRLSALRTVS